MKDLKLTLSLDVEEAQKTLTELEEQVDRILEKIERINSIRDAT